MIKSAVENEGGGFIRDGGGKEVFGERERVLFMFLEEITGGPTVSDGIWEEVRGVFSEREIVEVLSLQVSLLLSLYSVCGASIVEVKL